MNGEEGAGRSVNGEEGAEGVRTGAASPTTAPAPISDLEVPATARRRRFTAEYKRSILLQAEACREKGAIGAPLRRGRACTAPI